jgi:hypothetical protein
MGAATETQSGREKSIEASDRYAQIAKTAIRRDASTVT